MPNGVILSEAKNLSSILAPVESKKERFFASLRMAIFLFLSVFFLFYRSLFSR